MKNNKVGKPKKHTTELLDNLLLKYIEDNPNMAITFIELEKATGVGRNTWSRNMKEKIQKLNSPIYTLVAQDDKILPLPNMTELVKNNYGNQHKLIQALQQVNNSIQSMYVQAGSATLSWTEKIRACRINLSY
ncbi:hypothetical protein [Paenibacillus sp. FSL H8-0034]|uniref:hypothetical protein n=1 Tax=Paenibacillus sp. FSL H8-0034 TaxID=2954671 RepID=UPI0030FBD7F8